MVARKNDSFKIIFMRHLGLSWIWSAAAEAHQKIHGDTLWDTKSVVSESERTRVFLERHGDWPDPNWLEEEDPGYSARMAERTESVMAHTTSQKRWDEWMFLAQARLMPKFTERQYDVVKAPKELHDKLHARFVEQLPTAVREHTEEDLSGVVGPQPSLFFPQEELNYQVLHELTPMFSEWAGVELEPTSVYGVRIYRNGSILRDHLDVLETHVISGILHVASDVDSPFPIQIEDGRGQLASADLKPGDLMFYESAKCFHQRSVPMNGRYYASIFLHYRPVGWGLTRDFPRFAIPPWWADGLEARTGGTEDDEQRKISLTFSNEQPGGSGKLALYWVGDGGSLVSQGTLQPGGRVEISTTVGHSFVARTAGTSATEDNSDVGQWTITPGYQGRTIGILGDSASDVPGGKGTASEGIAYAQRNEEL